MTPKANRFDSCRESQKIPGINQPESVLIRMESGRFKVFKHLTDWFDEYRLYHRKDGRVYKEGDDLMSATRYAVMMLRHARTDIPPKPRSTRWDRRSWMSM